MCKRSLLVACLAVAAATLPVPTAHAEPERLEWRSCQTDADCVVVDTEGCIGVRPVARKFEETFRAWALQENRRRNCIKDPMMDSPRVESLVARCEDHRCEFEEKKPHGMN